MTSTTEFAINMAGGVRIQCRPATMQSPPAAKFDAIDPKPTMTSLIMRHFSIPAGGPYLHFSQWSLRKSSTNWLKAVGS